ncbi:unnamed protein product, partial [marine sediment metagenome]
VGIDGIANSAWTVTDDDDAASERMDQTISVPDDSNTHTISFFVKKDSDVSRFPYFSFYLYNGGNESSGGIIMNTSTGTFTELNDAVGTGVSEDYGDWWRFSISVTNDSSGSVSLKIYVMPAYSVNGTDPSVTAVGSTVFDQGQVELNQAYPSSPIITTTVPVTRETEAADAGGNGASWVLPDVTETLGAELITNGDFADWTTGEPDDWTVNVTGDATSNCLEHANGVQLIRDPNSATMTQTNKVVIGKMYKVIIEIDVASSDISLVVTVGSQNSPQITTSGIKTYYILATVNQHIVVAAWNPCDVIVNSVSVKEVIPQSVPAGITDTLVEVLGDTLVVNGTFDTDTTGWTGGTATISVVGAKLNVDATGPNGNGAQEIDLIAGKSYKLSTDVVNVDADYMGITLYEHDYGTSLVNDGAITV